MRALLVCPEFPLSFWSFRKICRLRGNKTVNPPLGLLTVAALLPSEWELRLADLNTRSLTEQDWQWADLILISAMYIQRAGLLTLVREAKRRGKTVVAGGPHPTSLPEAVLEAGPNSFQPMRRHGRAAFDGGERPCICANALSSFARRTDEVGMHQHRV